MTLREVNEPIRDALAADVAAGLEFLGEDFRPESLADYLLLPDKTISRMQRKMRTVAHEGGWEAAEAYRQGGMVQTYPNVCGAGIGGGDVCARRKGHDGEHDPDSTEVYQ